MKRIPPWLGPVLMLIGGVILLASLIDSLDGDAATAWVLVTS